MRAISSVAIDTLKSRTIPGLTTFLYLMKFSGVICFLISSSATPLLLISDIIMAYFSRAWLVTNVSGTSTSMTSERAADNALFLAGANSLESSLSIAFVNSSLSVSAVNPARTFSANSSVNSGRVRFDASRTVTSKMALFPAKFLSRRASGKRTETVFVSPTLAPTRPSTKPVMYLPSPNTTSTRSPLAASGKASPFSPSAVAMKPSMFTTHASPICSSWSASSIGASSA
mmetsp:Transcript_105794/g.158351  ORF Transcript_105794/g.158351 Transcript_105794/m.158351 type:complete len:230 (+) Transcript_105794:413-1102(+)